MALEHPFSWNLRSDTRYNRARWDESVTRLERLVSSDPAFFHLAVSALVEAWINSLRQEWDCEGEALHGHLHDTFKQKVETAMRMFPRAASVLQDFSKAYYLSSMVRHHFATCSPQEARTAGRRLCTLATALDLADRAVLDRFATALGAWDSAVDRATLLARLVELEKRARDAVLTKEKLQSSLAELASAQARLEAAGHELEARERELVEAARLREDREQNAEKLEKARAKDAQRRQEIYDLQQEIRRMKTELADKADMAAYLEELQSIHRASRTDLDYQQTLMRLSDEQEELLASFKPGENFLVRGGAGTGKTLILIQAIRKLRAAESEELRFQHKRRVLMLTYTRTLARYGAYLGKLIAAAQGADDIRTFDSWLLELAKRVLGSAPTVVYRHEDLARNGFSPFGKEEYDELEDFVWARALDHESYVTQRIPRTGRKKALGFEERENVWQAKVAIEAEMVSRNVFSRNALQSRLVARLRELGAGAYQEFDVIAVDEVQDLAPVSLEIVGMLASQSVIMAGDTQQSIYQAGFTFKSAGIKIEHRARILKRNYRNTRQIDALANAFLSHTGASSEERTDTQALRDGLAPRFVEYSTRTGFAEALGECLDFYTKVLEYKPSAIAILYSNLSIEDERQLTACLGQRKLVSVDIKQDESWIESEGIRVSSIHSAKGLDFPVVVLLLPRLASAHDELEGAERHKQEASLVYVGLTRALENLCVLATQETQSSTLKALKKAF